MKVHKQMTQIKTYEMKNAIYKITPKHTGERQKRERKSTTLWRKKEKRGKMSSKQTYHEIL